MSKGYEIEGHRDGKGWGSLARKFFYIPVFALGLILAGCSGAADTRATNALAIACDSFATVLDQLTPMREDGKISNVNIARVDATLEKVNPVCKANSKVDPAEVVGIVDRGVGMLKIVISAVGG